MTYNDLISRHNIKPWLGILPGYLWLSENEHRLDDWRPEIEFKRPGASYHISVNKPGIIKEVAKIWELYT